jgi:SNF family Na+-dependent transporter
MGSFSSYGASRALSGSNRWQWFAWTTILSVMMIMSFYFVVTGWFVPKARYQGSRMVTVVFLFILRWIVPIALIIIFLDSMNIIKI